MSLILKQSKQLKKPQPCKTRREKKMRYSAIHLLVLSSMLGMSAVSYAETVQAPKYYQVASGDLGQALSNFALQSNIAVSFDPALTRGLNTQGLKGTYSIELGFRELLKGTALQLSKRSNGTWSIEKVATGVQVRDAGQFETISLQAQHRSVKGAESTAQLPTINVTATAVTAQTEGSNSYAAKRTTTGKFEQSLREIPQSISVMTRKQLDDQNISNLKEAMHQATGVSVTSNGALGETGFQMRGYTAMQQQDGISVGAEDSYTLAPSRDMEIYDRIEVLRGPTGLLEGTGDPSGVINMIRRRPTAEAQGSVNLSYGSWNNKRLSVGASGALNESETIRGRTILSHQEKDYFYDYASENRSLIYGIVEADLTPQTLLTLSAHYSKMESVPFYGLPPNGGGFSRSSYMGADWNKAKVPQQFEGLVDLTHELSNGWKIKAATVYQQSELDVQMALATMPNPNTGLTSYYGSKEHIENNVIGSELSLSGDFDFFTRNHQFVLGATWNQSHKTYGSSSNYDNELASPLWKQDSINHPSISADDIPDPNLYNNKTETTQSGMYGVVKYKLLDPLTLIVGGRFSNYDVKTRGSGALTQSDWEKSAAKADMKFTTYGGLVWDVSDHLSWYASYTDIFSPQTAQDWQGKTIDPRVGWQVETGIKGEFFDGALNSALSVFRIQDKNRANTDLNPEHYPNENCTGDGISTYGCSVASGLQQIQGFELELVGQLNQHWNIISSYVYTDAEVLKTNNTNRWDYLKGQNFSPRTPRHAFKLWTTYTLLDEKLSVGGGINAQSALDESIGNLHNPGYAIFSLQAAYKVNPNLNLGFNVNNLFDRAYFAGMGVAANRWMYGEPRNFMLSMKYKY